MGLGKEAELVRRIELEKKGKPLASFWALMVKIGMQVTRKATPTRKVFLFQCLGSGHQPPAGLHTHFG